MFRFHVAAAKIVNVSYIVGCFYICFVMFDFFKAEVSWFADHACVSVDKCI